MKKIFLIFLFVSNLVSSAWGVMCFPFIPFDFGNLLIKDQCYETFKHTDNYSASEIEYCSCLKKEYPNQNLNNILKQTLAQNQDSLSSEELKNKQLADKQRLDRIYRNLNYEVGLQEHKYGLTVENSPKVGCTAETMANEFTASLCKDNDNVRCSASKRQSEGINFLKGNNTEASQKLALGKLESLYHSNQVQKLLKQEEKIRVEIILGDKTKTSIEKLSELEGVAKDIDIKERFSGAQKVQINLLKSPLVDLIKAQFEENDNSVLDKFNKDFSIAMPGACIDYDSYKVHKSTPNKDLMKNWEDMSRESIFLSLKPSKLNPESSITKFLQNNPVIAKNVITDSQRLKLAEKLKGFAQKNKGKNLNDLQRSKEFIEFMKTDIKQLNSGNAMASLLHCDILAQNYAAAANPELQSVLEKSDSLNPVTQIANNLKACRIQEKNALEGKQNKPALTDIIHASDLFSLFDTQDVQSPEQDEDYKKFLEEKCPRFTDFKDKFVKDVFACKLFFVSAKNCEKTALKTDKRRYKIMLEKYFLAHPEARGTLEFSEMVKGNTRPFDFKEIASKGDVNQQDQSALKHYRENVKPVFDKRSIYETTNIFNPSVSPSASDASSSITEALSQAQESYRPQTSPIGDVSSAVASVSSSHSSSVDQGASSNSSNANTVNPGQFTPSFFQSKSPAIDSNNDEKVTSIQEAKYIIEDLKELDVKEKNDLIGKTKEYLETQDQKNKDIIDLKKKIADFEKDPAQKFIADNNVVNRSPASLPNFMAPVVAPLAFSNRSSSLLPAGISTPSSRTQSAAATKTKSAVSYEAALNQANESRDSAQNLSLLIGKEASFDFSTSPTVQSDLSIGVSLEPSDKLYSEISSDPEAMKQYLAQNLKEVPLDKVVSIKCKGASCRSDASEILLVITKGSGNSFSVSSVGRKTKVARSSSTYKDLRHTIKDSISN